MILVQSQVVHFVVVLLSVLDSLVVVLFYQRVILKHLHQCCSYARVLLLELHCCVGCLYFHVSRREMVHNCYH